MRTLLAGPSVAFLALLLAAPMTAQGGGFLTRGGTVSENLTCHCDAKRWVLAGDGGPPEEVTIETTTTWRSGRTQKSSDTYTIGGRDRLLLACAEDRVSTGGFGPGHCDISNHLRITSRETSSSNATNRGHATGKAVVHGGHRRDPTRVQYKPAPSGPRVVASIDKAGCECSVSRWALWASNEPQREVHLLKRATTPEWGRDTSKETHIVGEGRLTPLSCIVQMNSEMRCDVDVRYEIVESFPERINSRNATRGANAASGAMTETLKESLADYGRTQRECYAQPDRPICHTECSYQDIPPWPWCTGDRREDVNRCLEGSMIQRQKICVQNCSARRCMAEKRLSPSQASPN